MKPSKRNRIIVLGDPSKYQFLKEIISSKMWNEIWNTNYRLSLANRFIEVEEGGLKEDTLDNLQQDKVRLTGKLPGGTLMVYPPEGDIKSCKYDVTDRIVFFDEFPFREKTVLDQILKTARENPFNSVSVILYIPGRKSLSTDITSVESAIIEAKKQYAIKKIKVAMHKPNDYPDFLFWSSPQYYESMTTDLRRKVEKVKNQINKCFEFDFELLLIDLQQLIDVTELEHLTMFNQILHGRCLYREYMNRFIAGYLNNPSSQFMEIVIDFYEGYIGECQIWDMTQDVMALRQILKNDYLGSYQEETDEKFLGTDKYEYKIFLMDTQIAVHFKIDLMDYMRKNLPELIKKYLINKLKKLEELANE